MPAPVLFASDRTAARMLDMPCSEFRELVKSGCLPAPLRIRDKERWDVDALQAIIRGDASLPDDGGLDL